MADFKQFMLEPAEDKKFPFMDTPNTLQTSKTVIVGDVRSRTTIDPNRGFFTNYVVRGIDSTGYSAVVVLDTDLAGLKVLRTNGDYGNATINLTHPGQRGQEMYLKLENDTDGNKVLTFGTPFKTTGTLTGSTAAFAIVHFISDGSNFCEVSRTTGLSQL